MNYSDIIKMRESRKRASSISKSLAFKDLDKDYDKSRGFIADNICKLFGLRKKVSREVISILLSEGISEKEITDRINFISDVLNKYGYDIDVLEKNIKLLVHTSSDLKHTLAITNMYGLDEIILTKPTIYCKITEKEIYSLIEELKNRGLEVNHENIQYLYIEYSNKEGLYELREKYSIDGKTLFTTSVLYNQKMNNVLSKNEFK